MLRFANLSNIEETFGNKAVTSALSVAKRNLFKKVRVVFAKYLLRKRFASFDLILLIEDL